MEIDAKIEAQLEANMDLIVHEIVTLLKNVTGSKVPAFYFAVSANPKATLSFSNVPPEEVQAWLSSIVDDLKNKRLKASGSMDITPSSQSDKH